MKKIIFGILASMLLTSAAYAGKGKKNRKSSKAETCTATTCDKTQCPPNCASMPNRFVNESPSRKWWAFLLGKITQQ